MAKVKITLEAEIGDLSCFWPDDPKGVAKENVVGFVHDQLKSLPLERIVHHMADQKTMDAPTYAAVMKIYEQEAELGKRLVASAKFEIESENHG